MLVLRFAETAVELQLHELLLVLLFGAIGGIVMIIGGAVFGFSNVGVGLIVMGIGWSFISFGMSLANPDAVQPWWMMAAVLAVIGGAVVYVLDDVLGVIDVDLYPMYALFRNMRI